MSAKIDAGGEGGKEETKNVVIETVTMAGATRQQLSGLLQVTGEGGNSNDSERTDGRALLNDAVKGYTPGEDAGGGEGDAAPEKPDNSVLDHVMYRFDNYVSTRSGQVGKDQCDICFHFVVFSCRQHGIMASTGDLAFRRLCVLDLPRWCVLCCGEHALHSSLRTTKP